MINANEHQLEVLNNAWLASIQMLHEMNDLVVTINDGRIIAAEFNPPAANN